LYEARFNFVQIPSASRARAIRLIYRDIKFVRVRLRDRDRSLIALACKGNGPGARPVWRGGKKNTLLVQLRFYDPTSNNWRSRHPAFFTLPRKRHTERCVSDFSPPSSRTLWRVLLRRVSLNLSAHKSRRVTLLRAVRHWSANDVPRAPGSESVYELRSAHEGERNATIRMRYTASRCRNVNIATADSNGFYLGSCQGLPHFLSSSDIFQHSPGIFS